MAQLSYCRSQSRSFIAALIVAASLVACSGGSGGDSSGDENSVKKGEFYETVALLTTPEALSGFMQRYVTYTSSAQRVASEKNGHWWKLPDETYQDGYGYCYDLSAFALYCLLDNGFDDARLMFACFGDWGNASNSGHFVAYFTRGGAYWTINNGALHGPYNNLQGVIADASFGNNITTYRIFAYNEIPFHTPYADMDYFCD